MSDDNGGIELAAETRRALEEMKLWLTRISVTLDSIPARLSDHEDRLRSLESATDVQNRMTRHESQLGDHEGQLGDHEERLRGIERWRWKAIGITIPITAILTAASAAFFKTFFGG